MHQYEDLLVDALLDRGFTIDEAMRLIELQDRLETERQEDEELRRFAEWMSQMHDDQATGE